MYKKSVMHVQSCCFAVLVAVAILPRPYFLPLILELFIFHLNFLILRLIFAIRKKVTLWSCVLLRFMMIQCDNRDNFTLSSLHISKTNGRYLK